MQKLNLCQFLCNFKHLKKLTPLTYIQCQIQNPAYQAFEAVAPPTGQKKFNLKNQKQNASFIVEGKTLMRTLINVTLQLLGLIEEKAKGILTWMIHRHFNVLKEMHGR